MEFWDDGPTRWAVVKKGGSSTLGKSIRPNSRKKGDLSRLVVIVRHPFARLVSGWSDLIVGRGHNFVHVSPLARKNFDQFVAEISSKRPETIDHHFRPYTLELAEIAKNTVFPYGGQVCVGLLECLDEFVWDRLEEIAGRPLSREHRRKSAHDPWPLYFEEYRTFEKASAYYSADLRMWRRVKSYGGWWEAKGLTNALQCGIIFL